MDNRTVPWLALFLAVVAMGVSVFALLRSPRPNAARVEEQVYHRILTDVYSELKPVYSDYGITFEKEPSTLAEVVRPLIGVNKSVRAQP